MVIGVFPLQMATNAESITTSWRHNAVGTMNPKNYHNEAETKWTPFRRRHFQMNFLEWNYMNSD